MFQLRLLLLGVSILGFFFGLYWFITGFSVFWRKRLVENVPTSKIRSIAMGLVEVYGTASPWNNALLKSPASGTECLYYHYTEDAYLYQGQYGDQGGHRWVRMNDVAASVPFLLSDETGSVLVDERGAEVDVSNMERVRELATGSKRTKEVLILPGDRLHIMGTAGRNIFTKPGSAQSSVTNTMIRMRRSHPYYISDKAEFRLVEKLGAISIFQIAGGALLSIGCLLTALGLITNQQGEVTVEGLFFLAYVGFLLFGVFGFKYILDN